MTTRQGQRFALAVVTVMPAVATGCCQQRPTWSRFGKCKSGCAHARGKWDTLVRAFSRMCVCVCLCVRRHRGACDCFFVFLLDWAGLGAHTRVTTTVHTLTHTHTLWTTHTARRAGVSLVAFLLLQHRPPPAWHGSASASANVLDTIRRTLGPSSYIDVGSFARRSLPATERYATLRQRAVLHQWGRRFGCHTCGSRGWRRSGLQALQRLSRRWKQSTKSQTHLFVGDHQPPKSVAAAAVQEALRLQKMGRGSGGGGVALSRFIRPNLGSGSNPLSPTFRFYPQCVACSNRQGSLLSAASSQRKTATALSLVPSIPLTRSFQHGSRKTALSYFYNHGWRPRKFHLTGSVVAVWTRATANTAEHSHSGATRKKASCRWPHRRSLSDSGSWCWPRSRK
jgi:hypothetical protein